jgi:hypothetical protein
LLCFRLDADNLNATGTAELKLNVLMSSLVTVWHRNPYPYIKTRYRDYHLILQEGKDQSGHDVPNVGVGLMYAQYTSSQLGEYPSMKNGPVQWVLWEGMRRTAFRIDDPHKVLNAMHPNLLDATSTPAQIAELVHACTDERDMLADTLASSFLNNPQVSFFTMYETMHKMDKLWVDDQRMKTVGLLKWTTSVLKVEQNATALAEQAVRDGATGEYVLPAVGPDLFYDKFNHTLERHLNRTRQRQAMHQSMHDWLAQVRMKAQQGTPMMDERFEHQLPVNFSQTNNFTDIPERRKRLVDDFSTTLCDSKPDVAETQMTIREHEMYAPDVNAFEVRETAALASQQLFASYDALITGNHRCFTKAVMGISQRMRPMQVRRRLRC